MFLFFHKNELCLDANEGEGRGGRKGGRFKRLMYV